MKRKQFIAGIAPLIFSLNNIYLNELTNSNSHKKKLKIKPTRSSLDKPFESWPFYDNILFKFLRFKANFYLMMTCNNNQHFMRIDSDFIGRFESSKNMYEHLK